MPFRSSDALATGSASLRQQLAAPSAPITAGTWAPVGPQSVTAESSLCTVPPNAATCGTYGNASGRVTSLATDPTNPSVVYLGSAGGGVWKSSDGGAHWATNTSMDSQPSLAIGALAVDPKNPLVIYAATGEANGADSQAGQGILKSADGGTTWALMPGSVTPFAGRHIGGITVDRTNSSHLLVASDAGLFSSMDAGASWQLNTQYTAALSAAFPGTLNSGAVAQVVQDPGNAMIFWVSASDFCQTEIGDLLQSTNGGSTWNNVSPNTTPVVAWSRLYLGAGTGGVAYMAAAGCRGNLVDLDKTVNAASTWIQLYAAAESTPPNPPPAPTITSPGLTNYFNVNGPFGQGDYDNVVAVDPADSSRAVFGGIDLLATTDGGASFSDIGKTYQPSSFIHPDFHALAFTSHDHLYAGNDGGVYKTSNLGGVAAAPDWDNLNATLNTLQFYTGTALDAAHLLGGAQDNGSSGSFAGTAPLPQWQAYLDGDGTYTAIDPTPGSSTIYAAYEFLGIFQGHSTASSFPYSSFTLAAPCNFSTSDPACTEPTGFVAPFLMDHPTPSRLIAGTNHAWISSSGGVPPGPASAGGSWNEVSPDLTTGTAIRPGGDTIQTMTLGALGLNGAVMTGSRFGKVFWSNNSGAPPVTTSWLDATGNLPPFPGFGSAPASPTAVFPNGWISGLAENPTSTKEAWATIGGLHVGHVWHTTDASTNQGAPAKPVAWTDISAGPTSATSVPDEVVNGVLADPNNAGTIYIATDSGVMVCTTCGGATPAPSWAVVGTGLPNVKVNAISFTTNGTGELVAWTHGRGAWILPLNSPLMIVTPPAGNLSCVAGVATGSSQQVTIANSGSTVLNWQLGAPQPAVGFLTVAPTSGSTAPHSSTPVMLNAVNCPSAPETVSTSIPITSNGGSPSFPVNLVVTNPGQYTAVTPSRILDTRVGLPAGATTMGSNTSLTVQVAGSVDANGNPSGVPANGASAVVMNVTVTNTRGGGYLTIFPAGVIKPNASNLNFVAGQTVPNLVEVALGSSAPGSSGQVTIYNGAAGNVDVIFDVQGWVSTPGNTSVPAGSGLFRPLSPSRILDTRGAPVPTGWTPGTPIGPNQTLNLQVTGAGGVPGGATAVSGTVLNVTVTSPTAPSYLTVFPTGASRPLASNLNFVAGQTVPNRVMVKVGSGGQVSIYNPSGSVQVVVDVGGWFTDASNPAATGGQFTALTPARIMETRPAFGTIGGYSAPQGANQTDSLLVAGVAGIPAMDAAVPPTAVVMNVTVTDTSQASYLTVYPSDTPTRPLASDLNWTGGQTVPNLVVVKLGADGKIDLYNPSASTDLIVDVVGWYN